MDIIFKEYQKEIIQRILEQNQKRYFCVIGNLIDNWVYPDIFIELINENNCPVHIRKSYFDKVAQEYGSAGINILISDLNDRFLDLIVLINNLKAEGYILFSGDFDLKQLGSKVTQIEDGKEISPEYIIYSFEDKSVINSLYHFSKKRIKSTLKLEEYVKNGFRTKDERDADTKNRRDKILYRISLFGLIFTAFGTIFSTFWELHKIGQTQKIEITNQKIRIESNCCDTMRQADFNSQVPNIDNLYFEFDSTGILPASEYQLETIIQYALKNRGSLIEIIGNTDSIGTLDYNYRLSVKRAEEVAKKFVINGINKNRIRTMGYGEWFPLAKQDYYGRWKNRRVQIRIMR